MGRVRRIIGLAAACWIAVACERGEAPVEVPPASERTPGDASVHWERGRPSPQDLESARMDMSWRRVVQIDTVAEEDGQANPESWDDISVASVASEPMHLPLHGDVAGPSVLRAQILLDRALFSPGILDGRWGTNTEKAIYWFQRREGIPATGVLNRPTFDRLAQLAGNPASLLREHRLSEADVTGPFVSIPDDIYRHAELECSCYESLSEKLGEMFHTTTEILSKLNPGVALDELTAGATIRVPDVRGPQSGANIVVSRLVVSDEGRYVHALDGSGRILYHFPATLGSQYDPSPTGDYRITSITEDPWWHYQPALLSHVDDEEADARIPPGPNNAVGVVWMALNKPHYGIHGTAAPETIGYASSAGCVRLTNWDARFLGRRVTEGTPVEFRDT